MKIKVDPNWWQTIFDAVYLITDARSVCDKEITRLEVDNICELLPIQAHHRILDLCGGHGRHCFELYDRGYKNCTLLDYSGYLIKHAKKQAAESNCAIECVQSDARNTGLTSEQFDHICILGNSLGYIQESDADSQILAEAYRIMNTGGWLLVDVTDGAAAKRSFSSNAWHEIGQDILVCRQRELREDTIAAREVVLSRTTGLIRDRTYAIRLYEPKSLTGLLKKTGFKDISLHTDFSPRRSEGNYGFMNKRVIATGRKI